MLFSLAGIPSRRLLLREFAEQPCFGRSPVTLHRFLRNLQHRGRLFDTEPAEKTKLHHTTLSLVDFRKRGKGLIHGFHRHVARLAPQHSFVKQTITAVREASTAEDPANRRNLGGGKSKVTFYLYPKIRPTVQLTSNGPAIAHVD
jgi:hypothetical protein